VAEENNNPFFKCPHCPCIFLTQADLKKHLTQFGNANGNHLYSYQNAHGRIEHGYGEE
jgi:uncharacterized C2H2 Zn-finger protein